MCVVEQFGVTEVSENRTFEAVGKLLPNCPAVENAYNFQLTIDHHPTIFYGTGSNTSIAAS